MHFLHFLHLKKRLQKPTTAVVDTVIEKTDIFRHDTVLMTQRAVVSVHVQDGAEPAVWRSLTNCRFQPICKLMDIRDGLRRSDGLGVDGEDEHFSCLDEHDASACRC